MTPFHTWLQQQGITWHSSLQLRPDSVHTLTPLPSSTTVVRIPKSTILSHQTSSLHHHHLSTTPLLNLTIHVLHETLLGQSSNWSTYLNTLPIEPVPIAAIWEEKSEARKWCKGTQLDREMRRDGVEITSLKSFYTQTILPLFLSLPSYPPTPFAPTLSLSLFLKIYSLCSSRSFHIDTFHNLALVPLADLFNHEDSNSVSFVSEQWVCEDCGKFQRCQHDDVDSVGEEEGEKGEGEGEEDDDTCELITVVSIESGREVFNSYGTLSNARLLRDYGFMLEANLNDLIEFELEEVLLLLVVGGGGAGAGEEMRVRVREEWERVREVWYNGRLKEEEEERGDEEFVVFDSTRRLYIDADSRLSSSLWLLLVCLFVALPKDPIRRGKFLGLLGGGEGGDLQPMVMRAKKSLAEGVGKLVEMRLQSQFRPELSGGELLDLAERTQDFATRSSMELTANERLLLETLRESWKEVVVVDGE